MNYKKMNPQKLLFVSPSFNLAGIITRPDFENQRQICLLLDQEFSSCSADEAG